MGSFVGEQMFCFRADGVLEYVFTHTFDLSVGSFVLEILRVNTYFYSSLIVI